jgi:hypothetical protein
MHRNLSHVINTVESFHRESVLDALCCRSVPLFDGFPVARGRVSIIPAMDLARDRQPPYFKPVAKRFHTLQMKEGWDLSPQGSALPITYLGLRQFVDGLHCPSTMAFDNYLARSNQAY